MTKGQSAAVYLHLHKEWDKARRFKWAAEPESEEFVYFEGMEQAYNDMMKDISIWEMMTFDGMTLTDAVDLYKQMEN